MVEASPAKASPAKTSPAKTSPAKTSPAKTSPAKTSPAKTSPAKTSPAKTGSAMADAAKADAAKTGSVKTGSAKARRSSTVVRRQLGRKLRALREACGKTREEVVATKLLSRGKLELIEFGRTMVRPGDVYELGMLYGASSEMINALRELAVATTQEGWWQEYGGKVEKPFETYLDLESAASELRIFQPLVIYGLFQTEDYARAVERGSNPGLSEAAVEGNVRLRLARQQAMLSPDRRVRLHAVFGEAALRLEVAGPSVMRRQYDRLRQVAGDGTVELRVLPFRAGGHSGLLGAFTILEFDDPEDPAVAYIQSYAGARYDDQASQVDPYRQVYDDLWQRSVPLEEFPL
jgi:transcriptional regulator with XRE-family HTH domain